MRCQNSIRYKYTCKDSMRHKYTTYFQGLCKNVISIRSGTNTHVRILYGTDAQARIFFLHSTNTPPTCKDYLRTSCTHSIRHKYVCKDSIRHKYTAQVHIFFQGFHIRTRRIPHASRFYQNGHARNRNAGRKRARIHVYISTCMSLYPGSILSK